MRQIQNFWSALTFLTIIPPPRRGSVPDAETVGDTLPYYPAVGALIGLLLFGAMHLARWSELPPLVTGVLLTCFWAFLTCGLHLDGLADVCDAFFSSRSREEALRILKDPHIGTMGVIGLFGILVGKATSLSSVADPFLGLVAAPIIGRWAMVAAATTSRYARPEGGLATGIIAHHSGRFGLATVTTVAALLFFPDPLRFLGAWIAVGIFLYVARSLCYLRIGGLTGDCIGAIGECAELVALVVYSAG